MSIADVRLLYVQLVQQGFKSALLPSEGGFESHECAFQAVPRGGAASDFFLADGVEELMDRVGEGCQLGSGERLPHGGELVRCGRLDAGDGEGSTTSSAGMTVIEPPT